MPPDILGLHHVTATVDGAQADLDFCLDVLGLRLVKKTVNFDNHHVYHFYYGNEHGTPGTIWTTFPYRGHGVPPGSEGSGQITTTSFSVPRRALTGWRDRLAALGVAVTASAPRFGEESLVSWTRRAWRSSWSAPPTTTGHRGPAPTCRPTPPSAGCTASR